MRKARRNLVGLALLAGLTLTLPANAQSTTPSTAPPTDATAPATTQPNDDSKPVHLQKTQVDFVDSREGYWVNRGFNDMMFGANGGVINEARIERDKEHDQQVLAKIAKPPRISAVVIKNAKPSNPPLTINGKVVEVK